VAAREAEAAAVKEAVKEAQEGVSDRDMAAVAAAEAERAAAAETRAATLERLLEAAATARKG